MSTKNTCLVFTDLNPSQLISLRCSDGTHTHLSSGELREYRDLGLIATRLNEITQMREIDWIRAPGRRSRGVVRMNRQLAIRDQSTKIGAYHALSLDGMVEREDGTFEMGREKQTEWAHLMLKNMHVETAPMHKTHLKQSTNGIRGTAPGPLVIIEINPRSECTA